ncbi:MAG: DUF2666 family protein [Candidatus Methanofastidiosia archaeon]
MEIKDHINFTAKHGKWIVAKKIEIDEEVEDVDIARLLISVRETFNKKIFDYLASDFDVSRIEEVASELVPKGRLSGQKIAEVLSKLKSGVASRKLSGSASTKEEKEVVKAILAEMVLEKLKLAKLKPKMIEKYIDKKSL